MCVPFYSPVGEPQPEMFSFKKLITSWILTLFRLVTGRYTDKLFEIFNCFTDPPEKLPPINDTLLLEPAMVLAKKIRSRRESCVNVIKAYKQRISDVQPLINAVVESRFQAALREAEEVDDVLQSGQRSEAELEEQFPLLGVPFSVKEAISTEGMLFTAGVVSRRDTRAKEDAVVVDRLRKAGAIPIAVTNTSEHCFWMEAYNNLYGRTNNPYNTKRTSGGSSGGEGALLAAAGSVIGIGNDIGGSIRIPAFFNGVFGHKPSRNTVSNEGHFPPTEPILHQYIGTGPMCRYASDLKPLLQIMAGPSSLYLRLNEEVNIKKLKVYYMEDDGDHHFTLPSTPAVKKAMQKVIQHFRQVCDVPPQKVNVRGLKHGFKIWAYAVSAVVADTARVETRVFGEKSNIVDVIFELIHWCVGRSDHTLPIIMTVIIERLFGPKKKSDADPFIKMKSRMEEDFDKLLKDDGVFIMPTLPEPAAYHYANSVRAQNCGYVAAFNVLGLPATSCPVGLDENRLPIGVQVVAGLKNDRINLAMAREIEKAFGGWVCPGPIV